MSSRRLWPARYLGVALCLVAGAASPLRAQVDAGPTESEPVGEPEPEPAPATEPAAPPAEAIAEPQPDWESAPPPTDASGLERRVDDGAGVLWVPRVLFFLPKWAFIVVASPVRLAAYTYERYQLRDRFKQVFFNVDGTFGIYPVAFFVTRLGLNVGLRLVHKDVFGKREGLRMRVGFGGEFEQLYELKLSTGERLGRRVSFELESQHQRRNRDLFFGIGNGDEGVPGTMINPLVDTTSVRSRFRQDVTRFVLRSNVRLFDDISLHPSAALVYREFDIVDVEDQNIEENYDTSLLPGFATGSSNVYGELELRYDTRARASIWETEALDGTGWLVSGFVGWQEGFSDDPSAYLRYGGDVQRFIDLYRGNRILALRVFVEAVARTGGQVEEVPFVDLPRLGGIRLLRGYDADRFRDRIVTLGTVEYMWELIPFASAVVFVDAGRPFRVWRDFELDDFRFGFGGGLQLHTRQSFLGRIHVATSSDGGLFFNFSFDPLYGRRERAGRL